MKQYHNLFPKDFIEETLKDAPGVVHIASREMTTDEVNFIQCQLVTATAARQFCTLYLQRMQVILLKATLMK